MSKISFFSIVCSIITGGFVLSASAAETPSPADHPAAPSFTIRDIRNKLIVTDSLLKKGPVIIDFWATWCVHCMTEMKALQHLVDTIGHDRFTVLAISQDGPAERSKVIQTASVKKWPFIIAIDNGKSVSRSYQVNALPALFLIGTDGRIHVFSRGFSAGDEAALEATLRRMLDEKN